MARKRKPSFLQPKKIFGKEEYERYKRLKQSLEKRKLREEIKQLRKREKYEKSAGIYKRSVSGKIGRGISGAFGVIRRGAVRSLYLRKMPQGVTGMRSKIGKRGRPFGSVKYIHPVTGQPIGVYEYRKLLSLEAWKTKQAIRQQGAFSPQNLQRLRRIQMLEQMRRMSPESQTIPNTYGDVPLSSIMEEIKKSTSLLP